MKKQPPLCASAPRPKVAAEVQPVADAARLFLRLLSDHLVERDPGVILEDVIEGAYWPPWAGEHPAELLSLDRSARKRRDRSAAFALVMAYGYGREA